MRDATTNPRAGRSGRGRRRCHRTESTWYSEDSSVNTTLIEQRERAIGALYAARSFLRDNPAASTANQREFEKLYGQASTQLVAFCSSADIEMPEVTADNPQAAVEQLIAWTTGPGPAAPSTNGMSGSDLSGMVWPSGANGSRERATLKRGESIVPYMASTGNDSLAGIGLGGFVSGLVTGRWSAGITYGAQQSIGTDSAGGYLVPSPLAGRVIDLARNRARVIQAGAEIVPMGSSTLRIAKVATDPDAEWKAENALATGSDLVLAAVELRARTLFVGPVKVSVELTEDAPNVNEVIEDAIAAAIAVEIDRAALYGSGLLEEPTGLKETTGVDETVVGFLGDYDEFSLAAQRLWADNEDPNAVIYGPAVAGAVDRLKDLEGRPLQPPRSFADLDKFVSKNVNAGDAFLGDWSQLLIGMRTELRIEASRDAGDSAGSAFRALQVWIRGYLRADIVATRASAFDILTGITESAGS